MFPPPHQCSPSLSVFPPLHQYSPHPTGATPTSMLPPLHQCSPHSIGASPLHQCSLHPISGFSPRKPHLEESVWVVLSVAWFPVSSLLSASLPTLVILTVNGFSHSWRWGKIFVFRKPIPSPSPTSHACEQRREKFSVASGPGNH